MFTFIIGFIGAIISIVGWFGFHLAILVYIGTALYIVETIIEWRTLDTSAKLFEIVIFAIGCLIALFIDSIPWYVGGMLALAIYSLFLSVFSIVKIVKVLF